MKRIVRGLAALAVITAAAATGAEGQLPVQAHVGLGLSIPMGGFSGFSADEGIDAGLGAGSGYIGTAGLTLTPPALPIGVRLDASYMYNTGGSDLQAALAGDGYPDDAHYRTLFGGVAAVYSFRSAGAPIRPYLLGGIGVYHIGAGGDGIEGFEADARAAGIDQDFVRATRVGFNAGGGVEFRAAGLGLFAEARVHAIPGVRPFDGNEQIEFESQTLTFVPVLVGLRLGGG